MTDIDINYILPTVDPISKDGSSPPSRNIISPIHSNIYININHFEKKKQYENAFVFF